MKVWERYHIVNSLNFADVDCPSGPPMAAITSTSTSETVNTAIFPTCVYLHDRVAIMLEIEDSTSATVDLMCNAIVNADELGLNKQLATQLFTLWMYSSLLGKVKDVISFIVRIVTAYN